MGQFVQASPIIGEHIGNIPTAEVEDEYYAAANIIDMAAALTTRCLQQNRRGSIVFEIHIVLLNAIDCWLCDLSIFAPPVRNFGNSLFPCLAFFRRTPSKVGVILKGEGLLFSCTA